MQSAKPWQIAVVVLGLLGGVAGIVFAFRANPGLDLADSVMMVDVVSGELFEFAIPKKGSLVFPEIHPDTRKETLFPVYKDPSGAWKLVERYSGALPSLNLKPEEMAVTAATGLVKVKSEKIRKISR